MPSAVMHKAKSGSITTGLSLPGAGLKAIAARIIETPGGIEELIEGLGSKTARVKYSSSKVLRLVSERAPELLNA